MGIPGPAELLIIFAVMFLLFGAKKLPEMTRAFGKSLSAFQKGKAEGERELRKVEKEIQDAMRGDSTKDA